MLKNNLLFLFISLLIVNCHHTVNPDLLTVTVFDQQKVAEYPDSDELIISKRDIAFLTKIDKDKKVLPQNKTLQNLLEKEFKTKGNFNFIPEEKIQNLINDKKYHNFDYSNVTDIIQLGTDLALNYIAQEEITIIDSQEDPNFFKARIRFSIFNVNTRQLIVSANISFDSQHAILFTKKINHIIQQYFPIKGFIIETRGERQVAKITIGNSLGIQVGRELLVYNRIVKKNIKNSLTEKNISYEKKPLAKVEVIKVMENEAWVEINENDRNKIRLGQVVFILPE